MKAQEFAFQSKLVHHQNSHHSSSSSFVNGSAAAIGGSQSVVYNQSGAQQQPQNYQPLPTARVSSAAVGVGSNGYEPAIHNCRSRSMTMPAVQHHPNSYHFNDNNSAAAAPTVINNSNFGMPVPRIIDCLNVNQDVNIGGRYTADSSFSVASSSVSSSSINASDDYLPPSSFGSSSVQSFGMLNQPQQQQRRCAPVSSSGSASTNYKDIDHYNRRLRNNSVSASLQTINEGLITHNTINDSSALFMAQHRRMVDEQNHMRFVQQQKTNFMSGDPRSGRLAEFVSRMVYVIFWQGSDSFSRQMMTPSPLHAQHVAIDELHTANNCYPPPEFQEYTRYLLETMQVSCSTALLSLFYLHRLRPNVKQMFVDGTFKDREVQRHRQPPSGRRNSYSSGEPNPPSQQQYRRDAKLEYRLFTVALVLANKYLDDNSYSNKAWSEVTGLELHKINIMELEFMKFIDYSLLVKEREYLGWVRWLESFISVVMEEMYVASRYTPMSPLLYPSAGIPSPISPPSQPYRHHAMPRRYSEAAPIIHQHHQPHQQFPLRPPSHSISSLPKFPVAHTLPTPKSLRKLNSLNMPRPQSRHEYAGSQESPIPISHSRQPSGQEYGQGRYYN